MRRRSSYTLLDVEVTEPFGTLVAAADAHGLAVLLRRKGVPIAFWMQPGRTVSAEEVAERAREKILAEAIREELCASVAAPPLPSLTIAICTRDRTRRVARVLDSLERIEGAPALDVLVVDNAPSDGSTRALVEGRSGVRYLLEPRAGLNVARNRALAAARGTLLAFLDDDVVVDRYWWLGLAEAVAENPDAAAFTGLVLPLELETRAQVLFEQRGGFRRGFEKVRFGPEVPGNPLYPAGAGVVGAGANMVVRTDVLEELGGFDEALDTGPPVPGGGDLDLFYRLVRAGRAIAYEPRLLVFHEHRRETAALRRQYRRSWGLGFMVFATKCLRTDPERRPQVLRLIRWWFRRELRDLARSLAGRHVLPPSMLLGELYGGVVGLLGGYGRSRRRLARLRERTS